MLLGWRVADAYRMTTAPWLRGLDWGEWLELPRGRGHVALLPHPSGVNHLYNQGGMQALAGRVLVEAADLAATCDRPGRLATIARVPDRRRQA